MTHEIARPRAQRVDARTNAQRIIDVAAVELAAGRSPSLEEIAAKAELGVATLYRHFPNRESLVAAATHAVFEEEIVPRLDAAQMIGSPRETLIDITLRIADLADGDGLSLTAELADDLLASYREPFGVLLRAAKAQGEIREDLEVEDIPHVLGMLVVGLSKPGMTHALRTRYLTLMFDALRPGHPGTLPPGDMP
ncbi:TetR/AcrR family transcriptional regulator [Aeromicrobium terrae]|uniref:TetR/AcrR family transcriptional regulator n=1 Tax=Aeromicrobium terrae TaxID=2498846 RepID=A0A5C8NHK3_9ACTN|nr:TetR/AcrR family transcriptional regulator [Aeromicrobium terrae]TXL60660.1 TetR/AcrR family transcriptional regulator [Aeromicrobium terrae]